MSGDYSEQHNPGTASDNESDLELLRAIVARDRRALTALYQRYYHPLLRFLQRMLNDIESAQEAVNDVMLVVWNNSPDFAGRSRVSTWIMGIAYRKAMKSRKRTLTWAGRFKSGDYAEIIERYAGIEELTGDIANKDLVQRAMQLLPPKQRAVVELTYFYGYSYDEIAEIVGCPANTVKTRMFHARARLRDMLPSLGHDPHE